jgi:hypothetical protein
MFCSYVKDELVFRKTRVFITQNGWVMRVVRMPDYVLARRVACIVLVFDC